MNAGAAYCAPATLKAAALKFGFAMFGVLISSLVIFLGLTIYNKLRENITISQSEDDYELLKTPRTKEQAIDFYIRKNRLK